MSRCFPSLPAIPGGAPSPVVGSLWAGLRGTAGLGMFQLPLAGGHARAQHRNVPRRAECPSAPTRGETLTWGHAWDGKHLPLG